METTTAAEDSMHGSIFVLLKRFVENAYDYSTWINLLEEAGIERPVSYQMHEMYPVRELFALVHTASALTGLPVHELLERFGEFLVPDLLLIYKKYIHPDWRTYDMLLNTEIAMHGAVRREDARTTPPKLQVTQQGNKQLIVDYYSKRRMAGVAVGIIKGIAKYYNESDLVTVTLITPIAEETVQLQIDFLD
ncbi:heme NO-binding domain-containing protein [Pontibacter chitinilyticus]|uniref:heme NO-binding domain-containing protein n=1 Tax=Pontibacter chitinilyticus TaxID=2674989 RepID=UPI003219CE05